MVRLSKSGSLATCDNRIICNGLILGALELKKLKIDNDAPPAFLINTERMNRFKMNVSIFDNSWDLYDQDIPSAKYFLDNGINNIVVRSESIQKDLKKIFARFQKEGLQIYLCNGYDEPRKEIIKGIKYDKF